MKRVALSRSEQICLGIIEGIATLQSTNKLEGYADWEVEFPDGALNGIEIGASISLEGFV